jgi:hypothetical protein
VPPAAGLGKIGGDPGKRSMESPFATSLIQVVVGGLLVFLAGILIGSG